MFIMIGNVEYKVHKFLTFLDYKHVKALHLAPAISVVNFFAQTSWTLCVLMLFFALLRYVHYDW